MGTGSSKKPVLTEGSDLDPDLGEWGQNVDEWDATEQKLLDRVTAAGLKEEPTDLLTQGMDDNYFNSQEREKYELAPALRPPSSHAQRLQWRRGELIGHGAYGQVYVALNLMSGELMAVKQVFTGYNNNSDGADTSAADKTMSFLRTEIELLRSLDHANIVRYRGTDAGLNRFSIFMDYVPGGSIASMLKKFGFFNETLVRVYCKQILQGLDYLHRHRIVHSDIKGANILVDTTGVCKLADFGASRQGERVSDPTSRLGASRQGGTNTPSHNPLTNVPSPSVAELAARSQVRDTPTL
jgi:serine/threonine protein kinase